MSTDLSIFTQAAESFFTGDNAKGNALLSKGYGLCPDAQTTIARQIWEIKGSPAVISQVAYAKSCFENDEATAEERARAINAYIQIKRPIAEPKTLEDYWSLTSVVQTCFDHLEKVAGWAEENALLMAVLLHK